MPPSKRTASFFQQTAKGIKMELKNPYSEKFEKLVKLTADINEKSSDLQQLLKEIVAIAERTRKMDSFIKG